jgi:ABC-type glycerol-3-phosphate transport system substrate-binding protein
MKGNNFQLILIIIFITLAIFGVLVFSGAIPIGNDDTPGALGTVTLWGTIRGDVISPLVEDFNNTNKSFILIYVQKSPETFDSELLEALADQKGPDLIFLPDELAVHYANKIAMMSYDSYPLATFKNNFTQAGEVFLSSKGIVALPILVDPMVMYYNRSLLDASGVIYPPKNWDEVLSVAPTLTTKDDTNKLLRSAFAMGQFSNVTHAKDIISSLFMQTGNQIVTESGGSYYSLIGNDSARFNLPAVLKFYTDFANPNSSSYSWNKSFPQSRDAFSAENLAFYFGYASELPELVSRNPNQNFLATTFPQIKNSSFKSTIAHTTGVAVMASSKNIVTALGAANLLATGRFAALLAPALGVAPAMRSLLVDKPKDAYSPTFYDSALFAKSWADPSSKDTDNIFRNMIEDILSNKNSPSGSIADANSRMTLLLLK